MLEERVQEQSARPEFKEVQRNSVLIRAYVRPDNLPVGKGRMDRFLRNMADAGGKEWVFRRAFYLNPQSYLNAIPLVRKMKSGDVMGLFLDKDQYGKDRSYSVHVHNNEKDQQDNVLVSINASYEGIKGLGQFQHTLDKTKLLRAIHTVLQPSKMGFAFMTTNPDERTYSHDYKDYVPCRPREDTYFLQIINLLHSQPKNDDEKIVLGKMLEWLVIERHKQRYKKTSTESLSRSLDELLTRDEMQKFQNIFGDYESLLEQKAAKQIIASNGKVGLEVFPYFKRYDLLTNEELRMIDGNHAKNICFIGGGQLPISAIMYAQKTKTTHITIIEKSARRVALAQRVVNALGLQDRITIINKKAQEVNYSQMDAVIFAAMADPKHEILYKVSETDAPKIILLRTPLHDARILYKGFEAYELDNELGLRKENMHHYFEADRRNLYYRAVDTEDEIIIFSHTILYPFLPDGSTPKKRYHAGW